MEHSIPIACTLTVTDLRDRQQAWLKLGAYLRGSSQIAGGLALAFRPSSGVLESLQTLVGLEAECCPWMTFAVEGAALEITMRVTAAGQDGESAVRESFAPLVAAAPRA